MRSGALITCVVAGVKYLLHPQKLGTIDATIDPDALVPVTLLTTEQIFNGDVDTLLKLYDIYDDVFIPEFGAVLVEKTPTNTTNQREGPDTVQTHRFTEQSIIEELEQLPSGPYFLYGPNLYQAWRLYNDDLEAFSTSVIPSSVNDTNKFRPLASLGIGGLHKSVAVPSALYYPPPSAAGPDKPLSGIRVAISDALSINGVPRTLSSRAWEAIHPEASKESAKLVKNLVNMGAVIVGKTKSSQFSASRDWIDVSAPFSPRGDQYQRFVGSSAGASASLTGYNWLKYVVADDDRGDSLDLAASGGFFSLRPSSESLPRKGSKLASQSFSSLSLSARSIDELRDIAKATLPSPAPSSKPLSRLIRLVDLESGLSGKEKSLYEGFVRAMENEMGVKSQPVDVAKLWKKLTPSPYLGENLNDAVNKTSFLTFCHQFYRGFSEFRSSYQKKFDRRPYIEPSIELLWNIGANITERDREDAEETLGEFRDWFIHKVLGSDKDTAIVLPILLPSPFSRDEPSPPRRFHDLLRANGLAALTGLPSLTAPFAQLPNRSRITGRDEYRALSASVLGPRGSDIALIGLVQRTFNLAQWRTRVDTGRLPFPIGDNPRNVDDRKPIRQQIQHPNFPENGRVTADDREFLEL